MSFEWIGTLGRIWKWQLYLNFKYVLWFWIYVFFQLEKYLRQIVLAFFFFYFWEKIALKLLISLNLIGTYTFCNYYTKSATCSNTNRCLKPSKIYQNVNLRQLEYWNIILFFLYFKIRFMQLSWYKIVLISVGWNPIDLKTKQFKTLTYVRLKMNLCYALLKKLK